MNITYSRTANVLDCHPRDMINIRDALESQILGNSREIYLEREDLISFIDEQEDLDPDNRMEAYTFLREVLDKIEGEFQEVAFVKTAKKLCWIRRDLLNEDKAVPVGDKYISEDKDYEYRWAGSEDSEFQILVDGEWLEAYSIDFDFEIQ